MGNVRSLHHQRHAAFIAPHSSQSSLFSPARPLTSPLHTSTLNSSDLAAEQKHAKHFRHSLEQIALRHPGQGTVQRKETPEIAESSRIEQGISLPVAQEDSSIAPPSVSAVQHPPASSGTSDHRQTLSGAVETQQGHSKRFGWSLEQIAMEPENRYAVNPIQRLEAIAFPSQRLPPKAAEPSTRKENSTGLPQKLKARIESLSGLPLDTVNVHYNSPEPATLQALAYTQGTEIYVGPGQTHHVPHEAWHVVQQMQGKVNPTLQTKGVAINDDERLEREADVMGRNAEAGFFSTRPLERIQNRQSVHVRSLNTANSVFPVQRKLERIDDPSKATTEIPSGYRALYGEKTTKQLFLIKDSGELFLAEIGSKRIFPVRSTGYYLLQDEKLFHGDPSQKSSTEIVDKTMPEITLPPLQQEVYQTSLMTKIPPKKDKFVPPQVLRWDGNKYGSGATSFAYEMYTANHEKAKNKLEELKRWKALAKSIGVLDGPGVIQQIIEIIEEGDPDTLVLFARDEDDLLGVATFKENDTMEGTPTPIPPQKNIYFYLQYMAANPETQVNKDVRLQNAPGGVGQALYAYIEYLGLPIFLYAENQISESAATRAGYTKYP